MPQEGCRYHRAQVALRKYHTATQKKRVPLELKASICNIFGSTRSHCGNLSGQCGFPNFYIVASIAMQLREQITLSLVAGARAGFSKCVDLLLVGEWPSKSFVRLFAPSLSVLLCHTEVPQQLPRGSPQHRFAHCSATAVSPSKMTDASTFAKQNVGHW